MSNTMSNTRPPIPRRMQHLPLDARGYPIPWTVYNPPDSKPRFDVIAEELKMQAIFEERCSICGDKTLPAVQCLVGGPLSAFSEMGAYLDPAMHIECARYALQVCPYLAAPTYSRSVSDLRPAQYDDGTVLVKDKNSVDGRPPLFVLVGTNRRLQVIHNAPQYYLKPLVPYVLVQYWQNGKQLPEPVGRALARRVLLSE